MLIQTYSELSELALITWYYTGGKLGTSCHLPRDRENQMVEPWFKPGPFAHELSTLYSTLLSSALNPQQNTCLNNDIANFISLKIRAHGVYIWIKPLNDNSSLFFPGEWPQPSFDPHPNPWSISTHKPPTVQELRSATLTSYVSLQFKTQTKTDYFFKSIIS